MSTWHQRKAGILQLWHAVLYTVVSDPPEELLTVSRFADPMQAERLRTNLIEAYLLENLRLYSRGHDPKVVSAGFRQQADGIFYILSPQRVKEI